MERYCPLQIDYNIYFSPLTCRVQYHSTSDAPSTLKTASCEARLPHFTHLLRLSLCLVVTGIGNSLSDTKVFRIHDISIAARPFILFLLSEIYTRGASLSRQEK